MVTQNIKIIMDDRKLPDIRMVSGDVGRDIFPVVYPYEDAEESLDLTVYELRAIFIKPDNTFVIQDYLDGMIEIPEQAGAVTGRGFYQIRISRTGEEIYSGQGDFYIDDQILNDSMVESVAEVNGYTFPDDFLTRGDFDPDDYATKKYVDDAIAEIPTPLTVYSSEEKETGTWVDGRTVYTKTIAFAKADLLSGTHTYNYTWADNVDVIINIENILLYRTTGISTFLSLPAPSDAYWRLIIRDFSRTGFSADIGSSVYAEIDTIYLTVSYVKVV